MKNTASPVIPLTVIREDATPTSPAFYYLRDANGDIVAVRTQLGLVSMTGNRTRIHSIKSALESESLTGLTFRNGELVDIHQHIDLMY